MRDLINIIDQLNEAASHTIVGALNAAGYQTKIRGNLVAVLVQVPDGKKKTEFRAVVLADIMDRVSAQFADLIPFKGVDSKISSLGFIGFQEDPTRIVVKDLGVQGDKSAGVANEAELANLLQSMVEKYKSINVTFKDHRGVDLKIDNVTSVELTGKDVKARKKADVVLHAEGKRLPVSLKKLDAETWESADTMFGAKARELVDKLVDKGIVTLKELPGNDGYALSKEIVVEPTEEEAMTAIFGSDINPAGGIVIQTFKPEHFVQDGNNVTIDAHAVIKSKADIPESHLMVWLIRNNAGRLSKSLGIRGLRPMASVLTRAIGRRGDKDVVLVDKDGNVVERPAKTAEPEKVKPEVEIRPRGVKKSDNKEPTDIGRKRRS